MTGIVTCATLISSLQTQLATATPAQISVICSLLSCPPNPASIVAAFQGMTVTQLQTISALLQFNSTTATTNNAVAIPTTYYGSSTNYLRPDGFIDIGGKKVPYVNA
jgi:hypothetical protein